MQRPGESPYPGFLSGDGRVLTDLPTPHELARDIAVDMRPLPDRLVCVAGEAGGEWRGEIEAGGGRPAHGRPMWQEITSIVKDPAGE
jgi:hypothetical protein